MSEQIICTGCGIPIQTEDKIKPGYAPESALEREAVVCQRCFRLRHYNEVQDVTLTDDDFLKLLHTIGNTDALVVKIVDIFDFTGSWISGLNRFVGGNPVILVGNKVDLLPHAANRNRLIHWMKSSAKALGLKVDDVFLMSAEKGEGITEIADAIDDYRAGKDVYIVGSTNVGKSTFINRLIEDFSGDDRFKVTTSHYPGTTLSFIDLPLDDGQTMYDTPGIINRNQMAHVVSHKDLKTMTPKKEIKPKVYQLDQGQTLFFGGLGRLDFVRGEHRSFVCYMPNELYIHRTRLDNADKLYEAHLGELLTPPTEQIDQFPELKKHTFKIKHDKTDIVFSGLGWVTVNEKGAEINAYAPAGVGVTLRESLI